MDLQWLFDATNEQHAKIVKNFDGDIKWICWRPIAGFSIITIRHVKVQGRLHSIAFSHLILVTPRLRWHPYNTSWYVEIKLTQVTSFLKNGNIGLGNITILVHVYRCIVCHGVFYPIY